MQFFTFEKSFLFVFKNVIEYLNDLRRLITMSSFAGDWSN